MVVAQSSAAASGHGTLDTGPSSFSRLSGDEAEDSFDVGPRDSAKHTNNNGDHAASQPSRTSAQSFTPRSLLVGLAIGTLITFSNTYFGLQTGWISSMAMPSSLIGFAVFKSLSRHLSFPFTPIENVLIQTVAGAVGTMPLGCGFVGVIPALEFLLRDGPDGEKGGEGEGEGGPLKLGFWKLVIWSLGVCLFGVVFAVPLRREVIVREKLKFPSGTATALMINVLHGGSRSNEKEERDVQRYGPGEQEEAERLLGREHEEEPSAQEAGDARDKGKDWKANIRLLVLAFGVSAFYTLLSYFIPQIHDVPILGLTLAQKWVWTLNPSPAYIGQGIIMGPSTSLHMLLGAIIGWGVLSPIAKHNGWAPGPVQSWENGSKGWIVWVSLAIMLADSIINLSWLVIRPFVHYGPGVVVKLQYKLRSRSFWRKMIPFSSARTSHAYQAVGRGNHYFGSHGDEEDDAPPSELISTRTVLIFLPLTLILNVICMQISFGSIITPFLSILATLLALVLSVMGVRALGETDLNPVSGISKLTQLLFAAATPASSHTRRSAIVTNLLAGAVSESGALQAGDMMQDLKTGHLLGASPKAQFYGQLLGSLFGAVISAAVYKLYVNVYDVPGKMFQVPTAYVWIFTARLVTGEGLPEMAWPVSGLFAVVFSFTTVMRIVGVSADGKGGRSAPWRAWIPGGIAVAVGMYNVPSFTLARAIGGVIALGWGWWQRRLKNARDAAMPLGNAVDNSSDNEGEGEIDNGRETTRRSEGRDQDEDSSLSTIVILASGLILGEGVVSIVNLCLASAGVPHL